MGSEKNKIYTDLIKNENKNKKIKIKIKEYKIILIISSVSSFFLVHLKKYYFIIIS